MMTTEPASLTNEQLSEVQGLIKGADSVELKVTVPDADRVRRWRARVLRCELRSTAK